MAFLDETQSVERLQFFDGMRLFAPDLQGLEALNREMRWLHNRSLHQPGIGNGYAVRGYKGDRDVVVGPGYALDHLGREIVLTREHIEPIPPAAGEEDGKPVTYDLVVSYPEDDHLDVVETRAGVCKGRGATRRREQPDFTWIRLRRSEAEVLSAADPILGRDVQLGRRIILARVEILECKLHKLSLAERRHARPSCRPYMAAGREERPEWELVALVEVPPAPVPTAAPATPPPGAPPVAAPPGTAPATPAAGAGIPGFFALAPEEFAATNVPLPFTLLFPIGLTTAVDTSAAGFRTTPHYTARITGTRAHMLRKGEVSWVLLADGLISVRNPEARGFQVDVLLLISANREALAALAQALKLDDFRKTFLPLFTGWQIEWLGVED